MLAKLLEGKKFNVTINRLCFQLIENYTDFQNTALISLQPRGIYLGQRIRDRLVELNKISTPLVYGELDPTFHRDDFRRNNEVLIPSPVHIDFSIEGKKIILIDDVLYTGRTIRAGMDALLDFGRPERVELLVLVDRKYSRQLPIEPDYVGITVDTRTSQKVKVNWNHIEGEDSVYLVDIEKKTTND